jgi:hypothetical protein
MHADCVSFGCYCWRPLGPRRLALFQAPPWGQFLVCVLYCFRWLTLRALEAELVMVCAA